MELSRGGALYKETQLSSNKKATSEIDNVLVVLVLSQLIKHAFCESYNELIGSDK